MFVHGGEGRAFHRAVVVCPQITNPDMDWAEAAGGCFLSSVQGALGTVPSDSHLSS